MDIVVMQKMQSNRLSAGQLYVYTSCCLYTGYKNQCDFCGIEGLFSFIHCTASATVGFFFYNFEYQQNQQYCTVR